jgi:predicted ATPase
LNYFKNTVSRILSKDLTVLTDLVPFLQTLFPKDEFAGEKIEVSPSEAAERTLRVIRGFLTCVAFDDRPLVLFVDDLQWCSPAEFSALTGIIGAFRVHSDGSGLRNCLLIISYRVNELGKPTLHKLRESLDKVKRCMNGSSETRGAVEIQVGQLYMVPPLYMVMMVG